MNTNKNEFINYLSAFLQSLLIIVSYMIADNLGFLISFLVIIYNFTRIKDFEKSLIENLIVTLPLSYTSIIGSKIHHIFSWFYIIGFFLIIYYLYEISKKKLEVPTLLVVVFVLYLLFYVFYLFRVQIIWNNTIFTSEFFDFIRLTFLFILSILFIGNVERRNITSNELIQKYGMVILASAVGLLIQFVGFEYFEIILGNITKLGGRRISYDLFFVSYSTFSIVLAMGSLLFMVRFFMNKKWYDLLFSGSILLVSSINSARSGLFSFVICVLLYILLDQNLSLGKKIQNFIIVCVLFGIALFILLQIRPSLSRVFYSSGRFDLIISSWEIFTSNVENMVFGLGPYFIENMAPHMFFIEIITTYGFLLGGIIILIFLLLILNVIKGDYVVLIIMIFVGGLFVTKIQLVTWLYPLFLINKISCEEKIQGLM